MQVGGQQQAAPAPDLCPRRIVLKMLAVSSSHSKMQTSLSTERAVTLLVACVGDSAQENVVNALITLANIAQNIRSHSMVRGGMAKTQSIRSYILEFLLTPDTLTLSSSSNS